jgi:glycosyltransferase involved in cell wall biosynthesis
MAGLGVEFPSRGTGVIEMEARQDVLAKEGGSVRIVAFAYACEPGKGSEAGAGWVWSRMLAQLADVWVITRENNEPSIAAALPGVPEREHLNFEYVDLPPWMRFWKRGARGARVYYLLWQLAALRRARRLSGQIQPDLVWHLTWANAWFGSLAPLLPLRFIYGPVGAGTGSAWSLWRTLGWRGIPYEFARTLARVLARYLNPLARLAWHRADLILVQNPETRDWLPARHRGKTVVFPHVVLEEDVIGAPDRSAKNDHLTAAYAGRLLPWKGVALAIRSIVLLPEWRLLICGTGPDEMRLKRLATRLGVEGRTQFLGWLPREQLRVLFAQDVDVFIFPSLHDEGGWVVAEALAARIPVVCLDRGGPPVLGGTAVQTSSSAATAAALAQAARTVVGRRPDGYPNFGGVTAKLGSLLAERVRQGRPWRKLGQHPGEMAQS